MVIFCFSTVVFIIILKYLMEANFIKKRGLLFTEFWRFKVIEGGLDLVLVRTLQHQAS